MRTTANERLAPRRAVLTLLLAAAVAAIVVGMARGAPPRRASNGLSYSSASAHHVQSQPAMGSCHARGAGLNVLPDPRCTPGALNPQVTQATIAGTICKSGWTSTVRPAESITAVEKRASMRAYGDGAASAGFEYDHLVSLELGGAANDARNLWPEPDYAIRSGFYLNPKDRLERALNRLVCRGSLTLAQAQGAIAGDWVRAFERYG